MWTGLRLPSMGMPQMTYELVVFCYICLPTDTDTYQHSHMQVSRTRN